MDVDSDYQASAYDYDTTSEAESVKSRDSKSSISRKQFKPSTKKKDVFVSILRLPMSVINQVDMKTGFSYWLNTCLLKCSAINARHQCSQDV